RRAPRRAAADPSPLGAGGATQRRRGRRPQILRRHAQPAGNRVSRVARHADQALRRGEDGAALRLAERAHTMRPKTPWVLTNLLELQVRAGEWQRAQTTLAELVKAKLVPAATGRHHQAALLLAQSRAAADSDTALSFAGEAQDLVPGFAPAAGRRAELLQRAGNPRKAAKAIETAWRREPHPRLAAAYAALFADEAPLARVKHH